MDAREIDANFKKLIDELSRYKTIDARHILSLSNGSFIDPLSEKSTNSYVESVGSEVRFIINEDFHNEATKNIGEVCELLNKDRSKLDESLTDLYAINVLEFLAIDSDGCLSNQNLDTEDMRMVFHKKKNELTKMLRKSGYSKKDIEKTIEMSRNTFDSLGRMSLDLIYHEGGVNDCFGNIFEVEEISDLDIAIESAIAEFHDDIEFYSGYFNMEDIDTHETANDILDSCGISKEDHVEDVSVFIPDIGNIIIDTINSNDYFSVLSTTKLISKIRQKGGLFDFEDAVSVIKKNFNAIVDQGFVLTHEDVFVSPNSSGESDLELRRYEFVKTKMKEFMASKTRNATMDSEESASLRRQRELEEIYAKAYNQEMERLNRASAQARFAARETPRYEVPDFASQAPSLPVTTPLPAVKHSDRPDNDERESPIPLRARERIQKVRSEMDNLYHRSAERKGRKTKGRERSQGGRLGQSSLDDF